MPANYPKQNRTRKLRENNNDGPRQFPTEHRAYIAALAYQCASEKTAFYVSTIGTTGGYKVRVYLPDETIETYIGVNEDPKAPFGELIDTCFGASVEAATHKLADAWLAVLGSKGRKGTDLAVG